MTPGRPAQRPRLALAGTLAALLFLAGCGGGGAATAEVEHDANYAVRMAQSLFRAGRVSEALSTIDEALDREPDNARLHYTRGQLSFSAGRLDEAERSFLRALELEPDLSDAHNFLGAVHQEQGRYDEAERAYRRALANPAYPTPDKAWLNLGLLHALQGRGGEALDALRTSVELDPRNYKAHFELAALLDKLGRLDEAASEYEVAEPGYRNVGDYYYRLGLAYFRLGEADKARETLARVRSVAPGSESAAQADELLKMMER